MAAARSTCHMDSMPDALLPADPDAARWAAVLARDPAAAGAPFLYAVTTQGVFCRPGCPSRPPLRRNTRFFADAPAAEAAGFRACKRCDPKGERSAIHAAAIRAACDLIEASETIPSLATLADRAGYARHHFLRLFRDITGVTPRSYAESVRARRLSAALAGGARVADAVAEAGFGSESRVYEDTGRVLGMTPGAARRGGAGEVIRVALADSALGPLMVGATGAGICFIGFGEDAAALRGDVMHRFPQARIEDAPEALADAVRQVVAFVAEPKAALTCRSTCAARPSSGRYGRRCAGSRSARRGPIRVSRPRWACRRRPGRWRGPARRTRCRSPCPATGWSGRMGT